MLINIDWSYWHVFAGVALTALYFKSIKYDYFSVRGIVASFFLIFYPVTALVAIVAADMYSIKISESAMINSLIAYEVFIGGMLAIELLAKRRKSKVDIRRRDNLYVSRALMLLVIYIITIVVRLELRLYYHVSIDPHYNVHASSYQNILDKMHWVGLVSVFLIWYKYQISNRAPYLFLFIIVTVFCVSVYIPSGSRTTAFGFVPILLIYIYSCMRSHYMRISFLVVSLVAMSSLVILSGKLRVDSSNFVGATVQQDVGLLVDRLSDYLNTGKVVSLIPGSFDQRYLEGLGDIWQGIFPSFARAYLGLTVNFNDGPLYAQKIGLSSGPWTSVPLTVLGDVYSRFSWGGIVVFSIILGLLLKFYDFILIRSPILFKIILLVLYSRYLSQIYVADLQIVFLTLTREFILSLFLSYIIYRFVRRRKYYIAQPLLQQSYNNGAKKYLQAI